MAADSEFTIDELARAADTTVRSVRVYHERGLLPSPEVRGRIGYYGSDHLDRLQTISRLLGRGMKLNGIRELLEAWDRGDGLAEVLGVKEANGTGPESEATTEHDDDYAELPEYAKQALAASEDPLEAYRVTNPRCCDLATRLNDTGLPVQDTFHLVERLRADCDRIADRFATELFYRLAGQAYEESPRTPRDRTKLETDLAIARLIVTRAASELIDQAFARHSELPPPTLPSPSPLSGVPTVPSPPVPGPQPAVDR
ncbi:MerR family transcriptional regulator [Nocardia sp. NBC_00881]|uniref:MerR family transcriptional regulator n=1 Tax=Nocardia sp. NBC_00881 TaxID=2975995 RepID=UPI00386DEF07|nr:MerR family transcriptional regulator [Nocardia sp. NBC_00881]